MAKAYLLIEVEAEDSDIDAIVTDTHNLVWEGAREECTLNIRNISTAYPEVIRFIEALRGDPGYFPKASCEEAEGLYTLLTH